MTRTPPGEVSLSRYGHREARRLAGDVESIYRASYVEAIASGHSFDSVEAFMLRFRSYSSNPRFDLVMARADQELVGQAWGWPLMKDSDWWGGLAFEPTCAFTDENGERTFAFSEIMVSERWIGSGIARRMHDFLLSGRREQRATLLVEPDNHRARRAYEHWGWKKVSQLTPGWPNAPTFDVMVKPIH